MTEYRLKRLEDDFRELGTQLGLINGQLTGIQIQLASAGGQAKAKDGAIRIWVAPIITAVLSAILIFLLIRAGATVV